MTAEIPSLVLGEDEDLVQLESASDNREAAIALAGQARRALYLFSRDLDGPLYDDEAFVEAVSALARRSEHTRVHVLVQDSSRAVKDGHRLIGLAQRLSSKVKVHNPSREYANLTESYLVVDETGYLYRPLADRYEGQARFRDPMRARELTKQFKEMWDRSTTDPQLRRLHL